ncbi:MAG: ATP synthase subunit I [Rhodoferax sp.]|nr:ATP synthase subunit I [Rhodoferax sp.]
MPIIAPLNDFDADDFDAAAFKRLTRQEAQALRALQPPVSPWRVIRLQVVVGLLVTLLAWVFTRNAAVAWSTAYGALAVVLPACLFARGLMSQFSSINAMTAGFGFFVWEAAKIAVSVAMLFAAPRVVDALDWLAMLLGLVLTMKVYWVALLMRPKLKQMNKS